MDFPDLDQLNLSFGVPGRVAFRNGPGGLPLATLANRHGAIEISLYGAQLLSYRPTGHMPVLFLSRSAVFSEGQPIRGGIPVCWPWFGPHPDNPSLPPHGFARLLRWHLTRIESDADRAEIGLCLLDDARTRTFWPCPFDLSMRVILDASLTVELATRNTGDRPFHVTQALHTYFLVRQIMDVSVRGLEGLSYLDTLTGADGARQDGAVVFRSEVDRVFSGDAGACTLHDPGLGRQIRVASRGSRSTVLWNPWIAKSRRLPDFGDDEYTRMVCIETANARDDAVTLAPGHTHTLAQTLRVELKPKGS